MNTSVARMHTRSGIAVGQGVLRTRSNFFAAMALVMLGIVFVGFSRTFYLRPFTGATDLSGSVNLPTHLQIHGLILSAWYLVFFLQSWLITTRRTSLHRRIGIVAVIMAAGVVIASGLTAVRYISRAFEAGRAEAVVTNVVVNDAVALALFVAFVALGVYLRRRPEPHRRLMFFASIVIISPAFAGGRPLGQLFGSLVPSVMASWSDDLFIASALVALVFYDYRRHRKLVLATQLGAAAFVAAKVGMLTLQATDAGTTFVGWLVPKTY